MKLTFIGAAHEVTGSCHYVEAAGKRFVVDCGMEQGIDLFQNADLPVSPAELDYVLLTHAHIDHSGMLPKLYKNGFKGPIYATRGTCDLCSVMLRDSAHIQESETEWKNRKARRAGREEIEPEYTLADADATARQMVPVDYKEKIQIDDGIAVRFIDVGHLLGSAAIEVWLTEGDVTKKIVFSGDVGNHDQPIINDPQTIDEADYVLIESTYGDRLHGERPDYVSDFAKILQRTFDRGGNVVIPSFAVGRTQEVLYVIREIKDKKMIHGHDDFEVYVDSPLASSATTIYDAHGEDCFDPQAKALLRAGIKPFVFKNLHCTITSDESKLINMDMKPKVILSASGMCDAGRIRHHLKHNLWRPECTVCFVGYQSQGTLGRKLIEGEKEVKLFGEPIEVRADIINLNGVSGHADQKGLLDWFAGFKKKPEKVFVVHGEDTVTDSFAALLTETFDVPAFAPYSGGCVDLATGEILDPGTPHPVEGSKVKAAARKAGQVFQRLWEAGQRLLEVIRKNEGGTNKDLSAFAQQINQLADKWDR